MIERERKKFKRVNEALVRAAPELRAKYESETVAWGEEMGPHVIYGDILNPYLTELLHAADGADVEEPLRRVFAFLEGLLADPDPEVSNVAATTVAEHLESDRQGLDRARLFMGPLMAEATGLRFDHGRSTSSLASPMADELSPKNHIRVDVDRGLCIGSGDCVDSAAGVFELDAEDKARVIDPDGDPLDMVIDAAGNCPVTAIFVYNEDGTLYP